MKIVFPREFLGLHRACGGYPDMSRPLSCVQIKKLKDCVQGTATDGLIMVRLRSASTDLFANPDVLEGATALIRGAECRHLGGIPYTHANQKTRCVCAVASPLEGQLNLQSLSVVWYSNGESSSLLREVQSIHHVPYGNYPNTDGVVSLEEGQECVGAKLLTMDVSLLNKAMSAVPFLKKQSMNVRISDNKRAVWFYVANGDCLPKSIARVDILVMPCDPVS